MRSMVERAQDDGRGSGALPRLTLSTTPAGWSPSPNGEED